MIAVCRRSESRRLVAGWRTSSTTRKRTPVREPATASRENLLDGRKERPHELTSAYVESTLYTIAAHAFGTIRKHSEIENARCVAENYLWPGGRSCLTCPPHVPAST